MITTIMLMVTSGGAIEESYRYKEYGETTVVDDTFTKLGNLSSNINNWKRYTGRERMIGGSVSDPWYHYRARAYRADAGRFVQRDPVRYVDSSNMYSYVRGRPLNAIDPLGLCEFTFFPREPVRTDAQEAACKASCQTAKAAYLLGLTSGDQGGLECMDNCMTHNNCSTASFEDNECFDKCVDAASWCDGGGGGVQGSFDPQVWFNFVCAKNFPCASVCKKKTVISDPPGPK